MRKFFNSIGFVLFCVNPLAWAQSPSPSASATPAAMNNFYDNSGVIDMAERGAAVACMPRFANSDGPHPVFGAPGDGSSVASSFMALDGNPALSFPRLALGNEFNGTDELGRALGKTMDLDGDSAPELVVGNPGSTSEQVYVHCSSELTTGIAKITSPDVSIYPDGASTFWGSRFGLAVAGTLDRSIIAIGAPKYQSSAIEVGAVEFWLLSTSTSDCSSLTASHLATLSPSSLSSADNFGQSITRIGSLAPASVDHEDFVVGAPGGETNDGYIEIIADKTANNLDFEIVNRINGNTASAEKFGYSVSNLGDIDGDGKDDLIVGAPEADTSAGRAYVYSGADLLGSPTPLCTIMGPSSNARFGAVVKGINDITGDGNPDFAIAAPDYDNQAGLVQIYFYNQTTGQCDFLFQNAGSDDYYEFGTSIAGAEPHSSYTCDFNDDSLSDVIIGNKADNLSMSYTDVGGWGIYLGESNATPTPTSTPTPTPTPSASPTATPTPKPTPPEDLRFRLKRTGELRGSLSIADFNPNICSLTLHARITDPNLKNKRSVFKILSDISLVDRADPIVFVAKNLPKIDLLTGSTLHMIAEINCLNDNTQYFSNVRARSLLGCGVEELTPLAPKSWEQRVKSSAKIENPTVTARKKKRRLRRKRRRRRLNRQAQQQ